MTIQIKASRHKFVCLFVCLFACLLVMPDYFITVEICTASCSNIKRSPYLYTSVRPHLMSLNKLEHLQQRRISKLEDIFCNLPGTLGIKRLNKL